MTIDDASNAGNGHASIILGQEQFLGQAPTSEMSEEVELRLRLRHLVYRKRWSQLTLRLLQQLGTLLRAVKSSGALFDHTYSSCSSDLASQGQDQILMLQGHQPIHL